MSFNKNKFWWITLAYNIKGDMHICVYVTENLRFTILITVWKVKTLLLGMFSLVICIEASAE